MCVRVRVLLAFTCLGSCAHRQYTQRALGLQHTFTIYKTLLLPYLLSKPCDCTLHLEISTIHNNQLAFKLNKNITKALFSKAWQSPNGR